MNSELIELFFPFTLGVAIGSIGKRNYIYWVWALIFLTTYILLSGIMHDPVMFILKEGTLAILLSLGAIGKSGESFYRPCCLF
jgi:hypothetical protein